MKKNLDQTVLKTRREFLKSAARKAIIPIVAVYTIKKTTPNLFAREPF
jgi:hypothetical protein